MSIIGIAPPTALRTGDAKLDRVQDRIIGPLNALFNSQLIWIVVGQAGAPPFQNGWVAYNDAAGTFGQLAFCKDAFGAVRLRGLGKTGTIGTVMFTLPAAYRPTRRLIFATASNSAFGEARIWANGDVFAQTGNANYFSLDGVSFVAEQ